MKKEEEDKEMLALLYKDFVSTFEDNVDGNSGTTSRSSNSTRGFQQQVWVKSSTMVPSSFHDWEDDRSGSTTASSSSSSSKIIYKPQMRFVKSGETFVKTGRNAGIQRKNVFGEDKDEDEDAHNIRNVAPFREAPIATPSISSTNAGTKKRQLDSFLEELKRGQEAREKIIKSKRARKESNGYRLDNSSSITLQAGM
jgi:hypothetical protein